MSDAGCADVRKSVTEVARRLRLIPQSPKIPRYLVAPGPLRRQPYGPRGEPAFDRLEEAAGRERGPGRSAGVPSSFTQVLSPYRLALLSRGALIISVAGALLPAIWAARARPITVLRVE